MFYTKGVDITNDKQMFNFLKNHFTYYTLNPWNCCSSIANNVKVYNLHLSGDCWKALKLLESDNYFTINPMLQDWEAEHSGYEVYFNGRSGGYLVLKAKNSNDSVLPETITENADYEEYKDCLKESFGITVYMNRPELVEYTKLVQSFDKLCDKIRDYVDKLSNTNVIVSEMEKAVEIFNGRYSNDLDLLDFDFLSVASDGTVDLSEIIKLQSLTEAFINIATKSSYEVKFIGDSTVTLTED